MWKGREERTADNFLIGGSEDAESGTTSPWDWKDRKSSRVVCEDNEPADQLWDTQVECLDLLLREESGLGKRIWNLCYPDSAQKAMGPCPEYLDRGDRGIEEHQHCSNLLMCKGGELCSLMRTQWDQKASPDGTRLRTQKTLTVCGFPFFSQITWLALDTTFLQ